MPAVTVCLVAAGAVAVLLLERWWPLRRRVESGAVRVPRNAAVALLGALAVQLVEAPVVEPLARRVGAGNLGLVPRLGLPRPIASLASLLLLDYTLYLWHVLTHRVTWLWRFHQVHHVDLDLDASTALRFHFGELSLSTPWRAAQVRLIGVSPEVLHLWQRLLLASIVFHHSNLRLPARVDAVLSWLIVTPRLHGIHHSSRSDEMNSNWSSGLAIWDRLHGTFRSDVPQARIRIGVDGYETPSAVTLPRLLTMPLLRSH